MEVKSKGSLDAGDILLSNGCYSQSVHCFYYSVLQMMKHCLAHCKTNPLDYTAQDAKAKLNNKSTHEWLISEILPRFSNRRIRVGFDDDFSFLKKERVAADYSSRQFTLENGADCKSAAERMLGKLRNLK